MNPHSLLLIPAALLGTTALAHGTAAANRYIADADCAGLVVDMPRAEDGTTVTAYLNGAAVRTVTIDTFGTPVSFTVPSPDQTQPQTWRVTVVGHNGAAPAFTETVPACTAPTSSTVPLTTVPPTSPSSTVPTTVVVPTTTPSVASTTTVVNPPRSTTTTVAPPVFELPATGGRHLDAQTAAAAAAGLAGVLALLVARRRVRS